MPSSEDFISAKHTHASASDDAVAVSADSEPAPHPIHAAPKIIKSPNDKTFLMAEEVMLVVIRL
jgi:hypothetical protein